MLYPENLQNLLLQFGDVETRLTRLLVEVQMAPCTADSPNTPALEDLHAAGASLAKAKARFTRAYSVPDFSGPFVPPPVTTFDDLAKLEEARENLGDIDTPKEMRKGKGKGRK